ncbi:MULTISPECIES: hypothetical protein [Pseudofrankia]|uniref:hypothetical protein n=1 Tax=Pseudofrankia TaxID=2994363 RepID=UPI000234B797|nr:MULTISPECIES: hypothetical protein [Pseudofrankia]OHV29006.1 hypothetical protein BCD49_36795 [Pseudofrankia sp. EUN1h]
MEGPSHLPDAESMLALLHHRLQEITDTLVELLISMVHRIGARADKKVIEELVNAFKRVTGKENILFAIAEASLSSPDEPVCEVVFPAVAGGEQTLRDLVHEFKTKGPVYRRTVQTTLKASCSNHYRRGLIALLDVLEFRSNNAAPGRNLNPANFETGAGGRRRQRAIIRSAWASTATPPPTSATNPAIAWLCLRRR